MSDDVLKRKRFQCYGLLGKPIEEFATAFGVAPVESERELIQVIVQILPANGALVSAQQPPLH